MTLPPAGRSPRDQFLAVLPIVQRHAQVTFRHLAAVHREEAMAEAVAIAFQSYVRLIARGKDPSQFPTILATFAVLHVKAGRHVGSQLTTRDVLSETARWRHGFQIESLDQSAHDEEWEEAVTDNSQTPVPDQVVFRLDFSAWLNTLSARHRQIIRLMVQRHSTKWLAHRFGISASRISQLRQQFWQEWHAFHREAIPA